MSRASHNPLSPVPPATRTHPSPGPRVQANQPPPPACTLPPHLLPLTHSALTSADDYLQVTDALLLTLLGQGLLEPILCSALECWWDLGSTGSAVQPLLCRDCPSIPREAKATVPLEGAVHRCVSGWGAKESPTGLGPGTDLSSDSQTTRLTPATPMHFVAPLHHLAAVA